VGSVFNAGKLLTDPMIRTVHTIARKAFLTQPLMPPAHAAARLTRQNLRNGKNGHR
jgi:hypothetical protein